MAAIIGALIIGISLGLFGSGGSILTVPVLLYLLTFPADVAIAASLLIVGFIALGATTPKLRSGLISWKHVAFFGIPGMVGTYAGAWLGGILGATVQLITFAVLMLVAAVSMWRKRPVSSSGPIAIQPLKIILEGTVVGVITGFVGVGGGFLIVPALVLLGGLAIQQAVATSLVIIALKSFVGFYKYYEILAAQGAVFDWNAILIVIVGGIVGSFAGNSIGKRIATQGLQKGFAVFLVLMAVFVLWQQLS
ncbi:sulfite exporter TauE/SafE family protein [Pseudidiomarina taiwanensis]|uniref:Probable membrane transporter protein n=1 Tax=Pseudidiomarina taiwanensis TaxID=337250 RepID=A0A432ZMF1_9GAMM|nr:sulfite exporter TauE/SafE family protein [Pseudidiomarina taiwanensis]RUO79069.1 sulfite exporter TauE/SafE family protein [Pseudidiomarina taiwanensis]